VAVGKLAVAVGVGLTHAVRKKARTATSKEGMRASLIGFHLLRFVSTV
jgi:hypothetical protein